MRGYPYSPGTTGNLIRVPRPSPACPCSATPRWSRGPFRSAGPFRRSGRPSGACSERSCHRLRRGSRPRTACAYRPTGNPARSGRSTAGRPLPAGGSCSGMIGDPTGPVKLAFDGRYGLAVRRKSPVAACGSQAVGPKRRFQLPTAGEPPAATASSARGDFCGGLLGGVFRAVWQPSRGFRDRVAAVRRRVAELRQRGIHDTSGAPLVNSTEARTNES